MSNEASTATSLPRIVDGEYNDVSLYDEAKQAVEQIKFGTKEAQVSEALEHNESIAYINICTLENVKYCVRLTQNGYEVVGREYDQIDNASANDKLEFETVDALMNNISKLYVEKFSEELSKKLENLLNPEDV